LAELSLAILRSPWLAAGEGERRRWTDAMKHGYISAGGGSWYSNTLHQLEPGDRIWVNVPGQGYVGVGKVLAKAKPITEFTLPNMSGQEQPITEVVADTPSVGQPEEKWECSLHAHGFPT
jgi:hypothetical protein